MFVKQTGRIEQIGEGREGDLFSDDGDFENFRDLLYVQNNGGFEEKKTKIKNFKKKRKDYFRRERKKKVEKAICQLKHAPNNDEITLNYLS